jgi:hypothetical protein
MHSALFYLKLETDRLLSVIKYGKNQRVYKTLVITRCHIVIAQLYIGDIRRVRNTVSFTSSFPPGVVIF